MQTEQELKKKLLQQRMAQMQYEHQASMQQSISQHQIMQEQMAILKKIISQIMEPKARERLANLKMVKPEMALQLELYLVQLYQAGHLKQKITDEQLVSILHRLNGPRREFKITRK